MLQDVGSLFKSLDNNIFFFWLMFNGAINSIGKYFLIWYIEDLADENASCYQDPWIKTLQGLTGFLQCVGQTIFFYASGWIIKKLGYTNVRNTVLIVSAIRFYCYSLLSNPWMVLPIELLSGFIFAIFYSAMTSYAYKVSLPGTEATLQVWRNGYFYKFDLQ